MNINKIANKIFNDGKQVNLIDASIIVPHVNYPVMNVDNTKTIYKNREQHIQAELEKNKKNTVAQFHKNKDYVRISDYLISTEQVKEGTKIIITAIVQSSVKQLKPESVAQKLNKICDQNNWKPFSVVKSHFFNEIVSQDVTEDQILARVQHQMKELNIEECDYVISLDTNATFKTETVQENGKAFNDTDPRFEQKPTKVLKITIFYMVN